MDFKEVHLEFVRAFDYYHRLLSHKLQRYCVLIQLVSWIRKFLSGRRYRVKFSIIWQTLRRILRLSIYYFFRLYEGYR